MKQPVYDSLGPELMRKIGHFVREYVRSENTWLNDEANRIFIDSISGIDGSLLDKNVVISVEFRAKTRRMLERVRDGEATPGEVKQITRAVMKLSEVGKKYPGSLLGRKAYVLTLRYLASESVPLKIIAQKLGLDKGTISSDIKIGIEKLTVLLFGADSLAKK